MYSLVTDDTEVSSFERSEDNSHAIIKCDQEDYWTLPDVNIISLTSVLPVMHLEYFTSTSTPVSRQFINSENTTTILNAFSGTVSFVNSPGMRYITVIVID